jgi:hypothetical protein
MGRAPGYPQTGAEVRRLGMSRPEPLFDAAVDHRRRTVRQERHLTKVQLQNMATDTSILDDVVLPITRHDVGRKTSPKPKKVVAEGRRKGFKVWKTPFWKRRSHLWAERNASERNLA